MACGRSIPENRNRLRRKNANTRPGRLSQPEPLAAVESPVFQTLYLLIGQGNLDRIDHNHQGARIVSRLHRLDIKRFVLHIKAQRIFGYIDPQCLKHFFRNEFISQFIRCTHEKILSRFW